MEEQQILVSISCLAYNHSSFIRQCLDGMLMQITNFKYEILIHDDCSTDGTTDIIKEYEAKYPEIIKPIYEKENQFQTGKPAGSIVWNIPRAKGKYIAMCEGDDYWLDPYKLQKQVDILESQSDISFVYTGFKCVDLNGIVVERDKYKDFASKSRTGNIFLDLLRGNFVMTLTTCFRREVFFLDCLKTSPSRVDLSFFLSALTIGNAYYLKDETAAYRNNPISVTNTGTNWLATELKRIIIHYLELLVNNKISCPFNIRFNAKTFIVDRAFSKKESFRSEYCMLMRKYKSLYFYVLPAMLMKIKRRINK